MRAGRECLLADQQTPERNDFFMTIGEASRIRDCLPKQV
jgi:hypothetical protein